MASHRNVPRLRSRDKDRCNICNSNDLGGYFRLTGLEIAIKAGCPTCTVIYNAVLAVNEYDPDRSFVSVDHPTVIDLLLVSGRNRDTPHMATKKNSDVDVFTISGEQPCSLPIVGVRGNLHQSRSQRYLSVLSAWLDDCTRNHPKCGSTITSLPKRVLDVGTQSHECIKLHISNNEIARYVALSHCWGAGVAGQARTTKENLLSRKENIQPEELPINFLEAISIARELGVQYLWIDSLCIIQDDVQDWQVESATMASIYNNAFLVIGANCAGSSDAGFMAAKGDAVPNYFIAEVENDDGSLSKVYARDSMPHHDVVGPESYYTKQGPLSNRGWALQEQLLSRRMVHFENIELFWECRTLMGCECLELQNANEYKVTMEQEIGSGSFKSWHTLVNQYHLRKLTFDSDFLPALSGVITYLQQFGAGDCVAGIWKKNIIDELLWEAGKNWMLYHRAAPYRAPTWSWASIHEARKDRDYNGSRITFYVDTYGPSESMCHVAHVSATPAGEDANGAVANGLLTIEGKVAQMTETKPTGMSVPHGSRNMELSNWLTDESIAGMMECSVDLTVEDFRKKQLYGILLGYWPPKPPQYSYARWAGLMLRPCPTRRDHYDRVGVWNLVDFVPSWWPQTPTAVKPAEFFANLQHSRVSII